MAVYRAAERVGGAEIGRAQYLQAQAAGVAPESAMNPVLLKPGSDHRSHVVLRGQPFGILESGEYANGRAHLAAAAWAAYKAKASADDKEFKEGWMKARAEALTKVGTAYKVYTAVYPALRAWTMLDHLIPFTRGYMLVAWGRKAA